MKYLVWIVYGLAALSIAGLLGSLILSIAGWLFDIGRCPHCGTWNYRSGIYGADPCIVCGK